MSAFLDLFFFLAIMGSIQGCYCVIRGAGSWQQASNVVDS